MTFNQWEPHPITEDDVKEWEEANEDSVKFLDEITLQEWTRWEWLDVTGTADEQRVYARGVQRTPSDATAAFHEFREYQKVTKGVQI